jgi:hypothetical protein
MAASFEKGWVGGEEFIALHPGQRVTRKTPKTGMPGIY